MRGCAVYIACKMSGRDKLDQVKRAKYVCRVLKKHSLTPISPVIEEEVKAEKGKLTNKDKPRLKIFWKRDKSIIRSEAQVLLMDNAEMKSFGMEREYCLNRGVLWKPTVIIVKPGTAISVAEFEDDYVTYSVNDAAKFIKVNWGTWKKRVWWRFCMLNRTLPRWVMGQILAWR